MLKTECFHVLDSKNGATVQDRIKKGPQNMVRRKLADISNLPQNQRMSIPDVKSKSIETNITVFTDQLKKENLALANMLVQRNKLLERSGIELDRLRVNLLKMQEQNKQLALSNTQMLAELNSDKDRLKLLHHELGLKNGMIKARKLEHKGARIEPRKNVDVELIKSKEDGESLKESSEEEKRHKSKRNLESNGLSISEHDQTKDKAVNKRLSLRRKSARFMPAEVKPAEDLFKTINAEVSIPQLPDDKKETDNKENDKKRPSVRRQSARFRAVKEPGEDSTEENGTKVYESQSSEIALLKNEENSCESQEFGRPSMGRPSRVAAKKVQSYKEVSLNVKMRRPE